MSVLALNDKSEAPKLERSSFDLSHHHATTGKMGELIPILTQEVIPGDTFDIDVNHLLRFLPLSGPLTQRCDIFVHSYLVPNRILEWEGFDWEKFITGRAATFIPTENLSGKGITADTIGAYMGLPQKIGYTTATYVNLLPLLGYVKIYNDYYRNKVVQEKIDPTTMSYASKCLIRNWRKDYFTAAIPYPQLGDPAAVQMDISYFDQSQLLTNTGGTPADDSLLTRSAKLEGQNNSELLRIVNIDEITVDVNDLRYAYALQDWLNKMLKSGDDYSDQLRNIFGVKSSDARMQKAEYIAGYSAPVIINDITQNSDVQRDPTTGDPLTGANPLGTQGGQAVTYGSGNCGRIFVEEHGYIHVIASVIPKSLHYGGLARHFSKTLPLDFYFPQFAYLPEQEILKKEVCLTEGQSDTEVFGYIERYAEYKHENDKISGQMVDEFKHLNFANIYVSEQTLQDFFLKCIPREDAFAVQGDIHFYGQFGFQIKAQRPMPFNVDSMNLF